MPPPLASRRLRRPLPPDPATAGRPIPAAWSSAGPLGGRPRRQFGARTATSLESPFLPQVRPPVSSPDLHRRYGSTLARDVPFAGLMVTFYEAMKELTEYGKRKYLPDSDLQVSNSFEGLLLGGLAGGFSAYVTTPLDVIKTRLQVQGSTTRYDGWLDAIRKTWASEGVNGLFKGSIPRIIWYIPASAFTFMAVEFLREHFNEKIDTDVPELTNLPLDTSSEVEKAA